MPTVNSLSSDDLSGSSSSAGWPDTAVSMLDLSMMNTSSLNNPPIIDYTINHPILDYNANHLFFNKEQDLKRLNSNALHHYAIEYGMNPYNRIVLDNLSYDFFTKRGYGSILVFSDCTGKFFSDFTKDQEQYPNFNKTGNLELLRQNFVFIIDEWFNTQVENLSELRESLIANRVPFYESITYAKSLMLEFIDYFNKLRYNVDPSNLALFKRVYSDLENRIGDKHWLFYKCFRFESLNKEQLMMLFYRFDENSSSLINEITNHSTPIKILRQFPITISDLNSCYKEDLGCYKMHDGWRCAYTGDVRYNTQHQAFKALCKEIGFDIYNNNNKLAKNLVATIVQFDLT